jgi:proteasome lid subunit RPN8/RPN11
MDATPLALGREVEDAIRAHAREAYPHECCGALIGREGGVQAAFALPNTTEEGPRRRFLVRPDDYRAAERHAQTLGLDLLGFYHSHPDHPARPSQYDLDHAWPFFSYIIVSATAEGTGALTSWRLRDDRSAFDEEPVARSTDDATPTADRAAGVAGDR